MIGDLVFLDVDNNNAYTTGEPGVENVKVELFDSNNALKASTYTDQNGYYLFGNLEADTYTIKIDPLTLPGAASIPAGLTPSADPDGGNDHQSFVTLTTGSQNLDQDFGYQAITPNTISGTIWEDSDANGTLDEATPNFFENVTIILRDDLGNLVGITSTDWNGDYAFTGLPDGTYTLDVLDENNIVGDYWKSAGVVIGANNNSQPDVYSVSVAGGSVDDTADFGYYTFGAAIGNYVWEDVNEDGIQDGSEVGIPDVIVSLEVSFPGGVVVVLTDTTDATGYYSFENLLLDEDYVSGGGGVMPSFTLSAATPIGYQTTIIDANSNANDGADSEDPAGTSAVPVKGLADISPTSTQAIAFYDFGFSQIPLPVTLISFEVSANECNAELSWRSEVETDFSHYIVERSTNGSLTFEYLTKVEAKQNAGIKSYNFEDIYITGKAFYRLKMLNLDGTYSYSNIVAVETDCENEVSGIQLYPNPVASSFSTINMKLLSKSESVAWMVVTDNLGKELLKFPANLMEGENIMGIDISNLSPGSYFISVKLDSGKTRTKQFVKIAE